MKIGNAVRLSDSIIAACKRHPMDKRIGIVVNIPERPMPRKPICSVLFPHTKYRHDFLLEDLYTVSEV